MFQKHNEYTTDVLEVFSHTNKQGFTVYATTIENDPSNTELSNHVRMLMLTFSVNPQLMQGEEYMETMRSYFQMLCKGYMDFSGKFMQKQDPEFNSDVLISFGLLLQHKGIDILNEFLDSYELEHDLDDTIERINNHEMLPDDCYEDLKTIADFICKNLNMPVIQFLLKHIESHSIKN